MEDSDGEGAEREGGQGGGRRSARAAPRGGGAAYGVERSPCAGRGRIRRGRFRCGKRSGNMHLVYMMVNQFGMRTIDFEINS